MPCGKVRHSPHGPGINVDPHHAVRPDDRHDLVAAADGTPRHPHLVHDPLLLRGVSSVGEPVAGAVAVHHVDPVGVAAAEANQRGIVGMKLRMADRVVLAGGRDRSSGRVDHMQPGDVAVPRAVFHRHRPPAAVGRERRRAHGVAHHARRDHRHVAKVGKALLAEAASRRQPPGPATGREVDESTVV